MSRIADGVAAVVNHFEVDCVQGLYQYGSSVIGGLRPDSDIDLLMVTKRALTAPERQSLLGFLLESSGSQAGPGSDTMAGRPVELTSIVLSDIVPWCYPPRCDFLYGEWLRSEFAAGAVPQPHQNPDLAIVLTTLRQHARAIRGPHPSVIIPAVPEPDLRRAIRDSLSELLGNWAGDERNVLLTLARMMVTLQTSEIVSKDQAARRVMASGPEQWRGVLELAAAAYVGDREDDWTEVANAHQVAEELAAALGTQLEALDRP